MSSTQSPRDSFFSNPTAHYTEPIRPPRSNASRSQKEKSNPATLTAEALTKLSSSDKNEAATYQSTRIKDFLHRLPDPEDPSNSPPDTDLDILEAEFQNRYYCNAKKDSTPSTPTSPPIGKSSRVPDKPTKAKPQTHDCEDDALPSSPTARLSSARPRAIPQPHHIPLLSQDMHLYHRFQTMQSEEVYAQFWRHKAWLTLSYDKDEKVALFVGVDTKEHAVMIHKHMLWLRDKWLGLGCGLFYHVMGI
ncbi:hypothetical protein M436DRAFT_82763 [Aureobasidium namibiae CBS 147.97]|uniref:Uncharacterized protein n=1 Tax=Aureobasidium namibiae CBS 147.97 TaxID=1043004 RepID=A0A074XDJ5_9PEZI